MRELHARLTGLAGEPLVHFVLIGIAIFALYALVDDRAPPEAENRIVVSASDVDRLRTMWELRRQRPPTSEELRGLIDEHVREEILYREALALGLDRDDATIRRLLRQKFEFVTQDLAAQREPAADELAAYFEANRGRYRRVTRYSFTHIYFSTSLRGASTDRDARTVLTCLRDGTAPKDIAGLGDAQMLGDTFHQIAEQEIEVVFGPDFALALKEIDPGIWAGPLESEHGLHLVRIDERIAGEVPPLADVEQEVRADWDHDQRRAANEAIYEQLRARYEVVVEAPGAVTPGRP